MEETEIQEICERLLPAPQRRPLPAAIELRMCKATAGQMSHVASVLKVHYIYIIEMNIVITILSIIGCRRQ